MSTGLITCSCNRTVALDTPALERGLQATGQALLHVQHAERLCRQELPRVPEALARFDQLVVGCTQESRLFQEVATTVPQARPIRFVNLREAAGWGVQGDRATPKIAALLALAAGAQPEPGPGVSYQSQGRLLIIGASDALRWAERLDGPLTPTVLLTDARGAALSGPRTFPVVSGVLTGLAGWLGEFQVRWEQSNPIDLEACVRCGACVSACPQGAIDASLQVDTTACQSHRDCVAACGSAGAIDFERANRVRTQTFDLVFDLRADSAFDCHQPPQGYFHAGPDPQRQADLAVGLTQLVGEFEKPRFFKWQESLCAHARNRIEGCSRCIEVCSAQAIEPAGNGVRVEPHLCVGCGACATVCPSGAMTHVWPAAPALGDSIRRALAAHAAAGGNDALILCHDRESGASLIEGLGRQAGAAVVAGAKAPAVIGLPARVIPLALHHVASLGMDLTLAMLAWGASQVAVLLTGKEAPQYREALREQFDLAESLVQALGLGGRHFLLVEAHSPDALEQTLAALEPASAVPQAARFALSPEKRRSIEAALDHLASVQRSAGRPIPDTVTMAAASPFGAIQVNAAACTLCLSCTSACPEGALIDDSEQPRLRFIERNCVQCGLCERTCPEHAITLQPRYLFDRAAAGSPREVARTEPFACVRCSKPFGTRKMIEAMVARLSGHAMFGEGAVARLQMCADCRVIDQFDPGSQASVFDFPPGRG